MLFCAPRAKKYAAKNNFYIEMTARAWYNIQNFNTAVTRALSKKGEKGMMAASLLHLPVDLAAIGVPFLLRAVLPLRAELVMIAAAVALSIVTIISAFRMARGAK